MRTGTAPAGRSGIMLVALRLSRPVSAHMTRVSNINLFGFDWYGL
jgi:hypothetical protein